MKLEFLVEGNFVTKTSLWSANRKIFSSANIAALNLSELQIENFTQRCKCYVIAISVNLSIF